MGCLSTWYSTSLMKSAMVLLYGSVSIVRGTKVNCAVRIDRSSVVSWRIDKGLYRPEVFFRPIPYTI